MRRRAVVSGVSYAWHDTVIAVDYIHRRGGRRWGEWYRFTQRPIAVGNYRFMSLLIRQLLTFSFFTYAFLFACTSADGSTWTSLPRRCSPSCNTHDGSTPSLLCAPSSAFPSSSVLAGAHRQSSIVWPPPTASSTPPPSLHVLTPPSSPSPFAAAASDHSPPPAPRHSPPSPSICLYTCSSCSASVLQFADLLIYIA